jgi:hypothetical protein
MIPRRKRLLWLLVFLQLSLPLQIVRADTGPKPTMEFEFNQELLAEPVTIVSGILYECQESDCSDARPLEEVGPQGFSCSTDRCDAMAYGFAPYHRIEIEFSDGKTRQSNIFQTAGFASVYNVSVNPNDLSVEAQFTSPTLQRIIGFALLCACILCGGILLIAVIVFIVLRSTRK